MKYKHLTLIPVWIVFLSFNVVFAQRTKIKYALSGKILNLKDKVYLIGFHTGKIDSTLVKNGSFFMSGYIDEPYLYALKQKGGDYFGTFVLSYNPIYLSGDITDIKNIQIKGDDEQELDHLWIKKVDNFNSERDALINASSKVTHDGDSMLTKENLANEKNIEKEEIDFVAKDIIAKNPDKFLSLFYLNMYYNRFGLELSERLYKLLDLKLKEHSLGKLIAMKMEIDHHRDLLLPGNFAPALSLKDRRGINRSLSDYKGKYILLNFWASWCKPCRAEHPDLINIYSKFDDKKYEIISISTDRDRNEWLKAIDNDHLPWVNLCDFKGSDSKIPFLYNIHAIPYSFLIDPEGKIISSDISSVKLMEKLKNLLQHSQSQ